MIDNSFSGVFPTTVVSFEIAAFFEDSRLDINLNLSHLKKILARVSNGSPHFLKCKNEIKKRMVFH